MTETETIIRREPNCRVAWRENSGPDDNGVTRHLKAVEVRLVGKNLVEWTRPKSGAVVRKRLTGKHLVIESADGRDIKTEWRQP